jgi:hypothetical protein
VNAVQPANAIKHHTLTRFGKRALFADATFLLLAGGMGILFDFLGYFLNSGPFAQAFYQSPYTIGSVEAHGLAMLTAVLLYRTRTSEKKRFWHGYATLVHGLLGSANLLFWGMFVSLALIPLGVMITSAHGVFVIVQGTHFVLSFQETST